MTAGMGTRWVLADVRERLGRADVAIEELRIKAAAMHNLSEHGRLVGKSEGVRLAISYLDDAMRLAHEEGR